MSKSSKKHGNLLIVDDEVEVLKSLKRHFRKTYQVYTANSAAEGYEIMHDQDIQVILSDQRMPQITGSEFFKKIKVEYPDAIRLILTAYTDIEAIIDLVNEGNITHYLSKPWDPVELDSVIEKAFRQYWLIHGNQKLMHELQATNDILKQETEARKRVVDNLAEKNRQLQTLLQTIPDIVYFKDAERRYLVVSQSFEQFVGLAQTDIIGKTDAQILPVDLVEVIEKSDQEAITSQEATCFEASFLLKNNEERFLETVNMPIYDEQAQFIGLVGVSRDVTERKKAEQALHTYHQDLEKQVAERTAELTWSNEQLQQQISERKLIEENLRQQTSALARSNKELEQFAYVTSHDLQEPLRAVAGYLQFLDRRYTDQLDEEANRFITRSVAAATRMKMMINDLLRYSRVGTHGKTFKPIEVSESLKFAIANLQSIIEETEATITDEVTGTVMADGIQLAQLFQNLIGNALKFHSDQPPQIEIGSKHEPDYNRWLYWVKDNGIGLEAKYAERIFLIFQRLHTRSEYPGTGIGLAICKKIVERHNGFIWVESERGQGATFFFTIGDKGNDQ